MKKIGIIINPNSKKFRTRKSSLRHYRNIESELIDIRRTESEEEVKPAVEEFIRSGYEYIGVAGGDGTLHLALTEIVRTSGQGEIPPLLILREGTMDNVARTINLKGRGPDLIRRLVWSVKNRRQIELHERDTIKIGDRYCFLFGTGAITNFLDMVYSGKEKGLKRNLEVASVTAFESIRNSSEGRIFRMEEVDVTLDGTPVPFRNINSILAGTVEHVGMSFSPLIDAETEKNSFQAIVTGMEPRKILLNINRFRTGRHIEDPSYLNKMAKQMIIHCNGEFHYTMDGDIYTAVNELHVETGPRVKLVKV